MSDKIIDLVAERIPVAEPAPARPTGPKTMVVFKWTNNEEPPQLREGRLFLDGVPDLLYQAQVEQAEQLILERHPQMTSVVITDWKALHG